MISRQSRLALFVAVAATFCHGEPSGKDSQLLEHILGKQQSGPGDFVSTLFNIFSTPRDPSEAKKKDPSTSSLIKRAKKVSGKGAGKSTTKKAITGGSEWSTVEEDAEAAGGKNDAKARSHKGGKKGGSGGGGETPQAPHQTAAAVGGLLPTRVYVINQDREVERWVQFRGRWALVHSVGGEALPRNDSAPDPAFTPVRFRAADLMDGPDGAAGWEGVAKVQRQPPPRRHPAVHALLS